MIYSVDQYLFLMNLPSDNNNEENQINQFCFFLKMVETDKLLKCEIPNSNLGWDEGPLPPSNSLDTDWVSYNSSQLWHYQDTASDSAG